MFRGNVTPAVTTSTLCFTGERPTIWGRQQMGGKEQKQQIFLEWDNKHSETKQMEQNATMF